MRTAGALRRALDGSRPEHVILTEKGIEEARRPQSRPGLYLSVHSDCPPCARRRDEIDEIGDIRRRRELRPQPIHELRMNSANGAGTSTRPWRSQSAAVTTSGPG